MADSHRLQVLKALTSHLQGITPANGYQYDLSNAVFRGRALFGENDPIPMLSILEGASTQQSLYGAENDYERSDVWPLLIQGWAEDDVKHPTDPAYGLMDAVEKRLSNILEIRGDGSGKAAFPDVYLLGNKISGLQYGPGVVRPPTAQVSSKAFFYLPVRVSLAGMVG